jgi:antitoxin MazE
MQIPIRSVSDSTVVQLPAAVLAHLGVAIGDVLHIGLESGRIILSAPNRRHPREGWADAAKALAEAGDDSLEWP